MTVSDLRKEYCQAELLENHIHPNPIIQFSQWFNEALNAEVLEANAMSVSTVNAQGRPSSRILLIKEFDERGFVWFTNYKSRKGQELKNNPYAALLFFWKELERQVRIEGRVELISELESDSYFASRPLGSRLGAHASSQSSPAFNREQLEKQFTEAQQRFGDHPPRPSHWGGYRLIPDHIEFWQGRPSRLHDRILYKKDASNNWHYQRLQP